MTKPTLFVLTSLMLAPSGSLAEEHTAEDRLVLVHAILGEAGWRPMPDHPAMLHVLERRRRGLPQHQGKSLTQMAQAYSNFLNADREMTPHRKAVFASTLDTVPQWSVRLVDRFLENPRSIKDPCNGKAWHWGGLIDTYSQHPLAVDCGETANVFLALPPTGSRVSWDAEAVDPRPQVQ